MPVVHGTPQPGHQERRKPARQPEPHSRRQRAALGRTGPDWGLEGFVHASAPIRLGSLKRVLPKKLITEAGEIMKTHFQAVKPGPGNNYMHHPNIKKFLEETSLDPLASDKRKRVDYRASSASNQKIIHAKT